MAASALKPCQCLIVCIVVGAMSFIWNSALLMLNIEVIRTSINIVNMS